MPFIDRFEINIITALSEQLVAALDALTGGALDDTNINMVEQERGVYALQHFSTLVYVGKANNLRKRLLDHKEKIGGRRGISLADMSFKCLYVHPNWTALAPEKSLIDFYKASGGACTWNGIGFGPHDPGRDRETTDKPSDGFDSLYPIIDDLPCTWIDARMWNVRDLLVSLKENLPFLLRYQIERHYRTGHPGYNRTTVTVPTPGMAARDLLALIGRSLPGWQATVFPSHMILYEESRAYTFGRILP